MDRSCHRLTPRGADRVCRLRDEHSLPHGYAYAICREHERRRTTHG
ncbi:MAG: DUF4287 domain-containing protein [Acidothermus sp.]|nr:DUF4287 domain-containing protein [Acidothermus sp.]